MQTPLTTGGELWCSGKVTRSWSHNVIRSVPLGKNSVISQGIVQEVGISITSHGTYPWPSVTQIFVAVNQVMMTTITLSEQRIQINY